MAQHKDQLYSSKLIKLPTPEYVIFYNGNRSRRIGKSCFFRMPLRQGGVPAAWNVKQSFSISTGATTKKAIGKMQTAMGILRIIAEVNENLDRNMSL